MYASIDREYAQEWDAKDPLASYRRQFQLPRQASGAPVVYLCGNSLGLQPLQTRAYVLREMDKWAQQAVEGHFAQPNPWFSYHEWFAGPAARLVGANEGEVVVMNTLTVNLHLLMVSFYNPTPHRYKIMIEADAFPSDRYAVASQAKFHGFDPDEALIELHPREGEDTLRTEDIEAAIHQHSDALALVMLSGVNFYTGQVFDMERITTAGHAVGAQVGFDLAHAAGNVPLRLHDWGVDFAAWCSYKYLNAGPGGVAFAFVHERFANAPGLPRFAGWWGNDPENRFAMPHDFAPQSGAAGWQMSNAPVLPMAALRASLELFDEVGMDALREKSIHLTDYLFELLQQIPTRPFVPLTPSSAKARGSQVSLRHEDSSDANALAIFLRERGIVCDIRHDVIRVAPAPLYNTFEDVWLFYRALHDFHDFHADNPTP